MKGLADIAFAVLAAMVVIAVAGDELARFVDSVARPLCAVVGILILARIVWSYTSRW